MHFVCTYRLSRCCEQMMANGELVAGFELGWVGGSMSFS